MVNSDDPAYFGGYLNTNLIECQMALNLTKEDIKRLAINSFRSSFLSEDEKKKWIDQINNYVQLDKNIFIFFFPDMFSTLNLNNFQSV